MPEAVEAPNQAVTAPPAKPEAPKTKPRQDPTPQIEPPYRVLLHNDDVNLFDNVVRLLHRLTPLSLEEAEQRTYEAHLHGKAVLLSTHKERAELYLEQLTSAGLTVTMETDT